MRNAALVSSHNRGDVGSDDLTQLLGIGDTLYPARELRVPDESVTSEELAIVSRPVGEEVSTAPVVGAPGGLEGSPLHGVLSSHLAEVGLDDGSIGVGLKKALVSGGAKVLLASSDEGLVDGSRSLASVVRRRRQGSGKRHAEEGSDGLHFGGV